MFIKPSWPAPPNVFAYTTLREAGFSKDRYSGLNLATHVGDKEEHVIANRNQLVDKLNLPKNPYWLTQTHSNKVVMVDYRIYDPIADASLTYNSNSVCAVLTADCLPILICNKAGNKVAAIHAGWRGLYNGIIKNTINCLEESPEELLAWLGPAISVKYFQVGKELREQFINQNSENYRAFYPAEQKDFFMANLYTLARIQLNDMHIFDIYGDEQCTYEQENKFYSFRRNAITGRMASLIWFSSSML